MEDREYVLSAFFDDFLKVAKVNVITGEYRFVKTLETEERLGCLSAETIDKYINNIVDNKLCHPDDEGSYLYHTNLGYLRSRISVHKRRMVHSFRRKINDAYIWVTFEITVPKDYSEENPWVVFSWKESDSDSCALEDALRMLSSIFHKILKINLTTDTHEEIKVYDEELTQLNGFSPKISEWLVNFAGTGNVYEDDIDGYLSFTDMDYMRTHFKNGRDYIRYRYRRKIGDSFRWVSMELIPSIEYTDDNQIIMMYIRDIHDDYVAELNYQKELEYYCNYDILTGIWNRYYYKNFCLSYERKAVKNAMAVLFADINGLKYVNDNFGHIKGDEYIKSFSRLLVDTFGMRSCCRISGDEFIVFFTDDGEEEVKKKFSDFHNRLQQQKLPIASIGYAWSAAPDTIEELVKEAESAMYKDKQEYYRKHPKYVR